MIDIQSVFVYVGLPILLCMLAKYGEKTNSKKTVWLMVILVSLIAGLRAISVGIDTKTYDTIFKYAANGNVKSIYGVETSFIYICMGLLNVWNSSHFLLFVFALVSHGLILFRIWKDREYISFAWSVFAYYILFFAFSLNGLRQFVAVAFVFYATGFLKDGKYIKYIIMVLAACLFHTSAIVGLGYLLFEIIFTKYFNSNRKMIAFLLVSAAGVFGLYIVSDLINAYSNYFNRQAASTGLMMIVKVILLMMAIVLIKPGTDTSERYFCSSHRWFYFVGLLFNSLSYVFMYAGRIGLYYYIFESIYVGYLLKARSKTIWGVFLKLGYVLLLFYTFAITVTSGAQGEIPYRFFWQN